MIAFFHQNDVFSRQGGIERCVATLLDAAGDGAAIVSAPLAREMKNHFSVAGFGASQLPEWLRFVLGVFSQRRALSAFLRREGVSVCEYSRPEYVLFAWLFAIPRVFTIHGTGPHASDRLHYAIHHLCCCLLPLFAARVQIVGRDDSGLPWLARLLLRSRITHIDAWYDDRFVPVPFPSLKDAPMRVFYAGRLAAQKNPELLFSIIRQASALPQYNFSFHYFGSDFADFVEAGLAGHIEDHGFLGPAELARAIGACHVGILCSGFGEGSPFIIVESLACGRPFIAPPLPTLVDAYTDVAGVKIVGRYASEAFVEALTALREDLLTGRVDPFVIAGQVVLRSQKRATKALLDCLAALSDDEARAKEFF